MLTLTFIEGGEVKVIDVEISMMSSLVEVKTLKVNQANISYFQKEEYRTVSSWIGVDADVGLEVNACWEIADSIEWK